MGESLSSFTTHVSVYAVEPSGATGDRLGDATLVDGALVLLHPPLSDHLADARQAPPQLRAGLAYSAAAGFAVDVVDLVEVHVGPAATEPGAALVFAELAREVQAPVLALPEAIPNDPVGAQVQAALRAHLEALPEPGAGHIPLPGGRPSNVWCWLNPRWCHPTPKVTLV